MSEEFRFFGMSVPNLARTFGIVLIVWSLYLYYYAIEPPTGLNPDLIDDWRPSITVLIPAFLGLPMAVLGIMAGRDEKNLRHYMHAAMVVALFMALGGARIINGGMSSFAFISHLLLLLFGVAFMFVGIRSFRHARLLREAGGAE
ncbi:MAG: hypothetical protein CMA47_01380 [Euryarchaeota archaeon]|nr:hypothetical protein [Euryarchaeota archaeon]|tara:strand:- start:1513 stop:1947 length:435 start_codon:yes stop_codon:yes gene_type:complete